MDDVILGEIRAVGFNFAPQGWALCDGSLLTISDHQALFALLGTTYGGDGQNTFALPDLRGRAAVAAGHSATLSSYPLGAKLGQETVTLDLAQLPAHTHGLANVNTVPTWSATVSPAGNYLGVSEEPQYAEQASSATMAAGSIKGQGTPVGGGQPHDNRQPCLALTYIIALTGQFPPHSS